MKGRISPALLVSFLALLVSLSGTAYAVGKISGSQLNNRSVSHVKIKKHTLTGAEINKSKLGTVDNAKRLGGFPAADYSQNVWAEQSSQPLDLPAKTKTAIITQPFTNDAPSAAGFLNFSEVQVTNPGGNPAMVTLSLKIDGEAEPGSYSQTVDPGEVASIFAVLKCNGMSPGHHTVSMLAESTGEVSLGTRADDGFRPIVIPPGHSVFTGEG